MRSRTPRTFPRDLPDDAAAQLASVTGLLTATLGSALRGVILHGSAATSGFRPGRSDLDLLAIAGRGLTAAERRALGVGLLALSGRPYPLEISVVAQACLRDWSHPCAHELHFGEDQRARFAAGEFAPPAARDPDLAAHVTVARARGIDLLGNCPVESLPVVPRTDYLAALLADFLWAEGRPGMGRYLQANACRTLAYLRTGAVLSKQEGLEWCRDRGIDPAAVAGRVTGWLRAELAAADRPADEP